MTEEATFRGQSVDFSYFLVYGCASILLVAVLTSARVSFLSSSLNFMLIYVWYVCGCVRLCLCSALSLWPNSCSLLCWPPGP